MPRANSREAILDAAESVVLEHGAAHMTLDAVAERSKVSKGGLIYNFPTKEALLEAMIARLMGHVESLREKVRQEIASEAPNELLVEIKTLFGLSRKDFRRQAALLAVIANQPELMKPLHKLHRERFFKRILSADDPERSTILFFAALGLHFNELLNLSLLNTQQRRNTYERLLQLAADRNKTL